MANEKLKVNFHDKEMNLLEAELYLLGLSLGVVNAKLIEEEEQDYIKWKNIKNNRNEIAQKLVKEKLFKNVNERTYLIEKLQDKIVSTKIAIKKVYCETHGGHKEMKGSSYTPPGIEGAVTHYTCSRCRRIYEKGSNSFKDKNSKEKIYNPLII